MLVQKAIAACGSSPENVAKVLVIMSTLAKKGGNPMHIANAMNNLGQVRYFSSSLIHTKKINYQHSIFLLGPNICIYQMIYELTLFFFT